MPLILALSFAHAADVVWLSPPDDTTRAAVLAAAGGTELDAIELRASASDASDADQAAFKALAAALETVRPYEQQLDGELLIMRDLQRPIESVTLLRDEGDRSALFAALAYQGFAVDRFFGDDLSSSDDAAMYRVEYAGTFAPTPWRDAVALEPERNVSAYDIAEAPQRVRYGAVQQLVGEQLPASLIPGTLPKGSALMVDGRAASADATGSIKVAPGRHLAHVQHGDRVLQRWDLALQPGAQADLEVAVSDGVWKAFVDQLADGGTAPDALLPLFEARGDVWFARPGAKSPTVFLVDASGSIRSETVEMTPTGGTDDRTSSRPGIQLGLVGGWTGSHDFYYQNPTVEPTAGTVNAATVGGSAGVEVPLGPVQVAAGIDVLVPLGADHAAQTGGDSMRLRPVPHVAVGLRPASVAVGYAFPYHPAVGLRGSVPLVGPLELRWLGWYGLPTTASREGSADYSYRPLGMAAGGVGVRL